MADRHVPAVRRLVGQSFDRARRASRFGGGPDGIAWDVLDAELGRVQPILRAIIMDAGAAEIRALRRQGYDVVAKQFTISAFLDLLNPYAIQAAVDAANLFVQNLSLESQQAIRAILVRAQQQGRPIREQAREIYRLIRLVFGLTERQAVAVERYHQQLIEQGVAQARARVQAEKLADRYFKQRAQVIARHETISAANAGQDAIWRQMLDDGILPADQQREWRTARDERVCPICGPLHGQQVGMDEPFIPLPRGERWTTPDRWRYRRKDGTLSDHPSRSKNAKVYSTGPILTNPAHIQCRCRIVLVPQPVPV